MEISQNSKTYKKINENNETYTLNIKIKESNSIYISIIFEGENKIYEDIKSIEDIKKLQNYFEEFTEEQIFNEIKNLISKNKIEFNKKDDKILFNIILPSEEKQILIFELKEKTIENIDNSFFKEIINQKNEIIKQKDESIKERDEIIKIKDDIIQEKNLIINDLKELLNKYRQGKEIINNINIGTSKEKIQYGNYSINDYEDDNENEKCENFNDINILNENFQIGKLRAKKLISSKNKDILTIIQLNDGRLAAGRSNGEITIYNQKTFAPEITIEESSSAIWDIIQLKNNDLISCSSDNKSINIYKLNQNNKFELLYQHITEGPEEYPRKIIELDNQKFGVVAYKSLIFFSYQNDKYLELFTIKAKYEEIGHYLNMIQINENEIAISGSQNMIQFFKLNTRKLKEKIKLNKSINCGIDNLLCMLNNRCLCVGGADKLTLIDVANKITMNEIFDMGIHRCLLKINDNYLLTGKNNGEITQWKIFWNYLSLIGKKEKAHQKNINKIIIFNGTIASCSNDWLIKIWS